MQASVAQNYGYTTWDNSPLLAFSLKQGLSGRHTLKIFATRQDTKQIIDVTNWVAVGIGCEDKLREQNGEFVLLANPGYDPTVWINEKWQEAVAHLNPQVVTYLDFTFSVSGFIKQSIALTEAGCELSSQQIQDGLNNGDIVTTVQQDGDLILVCEGKILGKVYGSEMDCDYEDFETEDRYSINQVTNEHIDLTA